MTEISNKALGTSYEERVAEELHRYGFWVHLLKQGASGQPADLIACRNGRAYLIDAKVCSDGTFPLSRLEENQELGMKAFMDAGNAGGWFALLVDDATYMVPLHFLLWFAHRSNVRKVPRKTIVERGILLSEWVKEWYV